VVKFFDLLNLQALLFLRGEVNRAVGVWHLAVGKKANQILNG
jgi:hypothetical protein